MSRNIRPFYVSADCLPGAGTAGVCDGCATPLPKRRTRWCSDRCGLNYTMHHVYRFARNAAKRRDKWTCTQCGAIGAVEVDHIEAARGQHNLHSCVHHLENLRCLCGPCHKARTAEQRRVK